VSRQRNAVPARLTFMKGAVVAMTAVAGLTVVPSVPASAAALPGNNAAAVLAGMTEAQRVGQLLMVSASLSGAAAQATRDAITRYHAGSLFYAGRSSAGVAAMRSMTNRWQRLATADATAGVPLLVATDQEGGSVQTLSGKGFSTIPSAVTQGSWSRSKLLSSAIVWARQLAAAGVTLDLAPVLDTVPPDRVSTNQPIGRYHREYGTKPSAVTSAGLAVVRGMRVSGVQTTVKHFPGLGRASDNTDTASGVTDSITTRHDSYVTPYAAATRAADADFVMVSHATYTRIDPNHRAVFSPTILDGMLRGDLGFTGVIMSDSMYAVAVRDLSPGERAVRFVAAGGDLVLTGLPEDVPAMASALLAKANSDAAFRSRVDASCLRILLAKQRAGLLGGETAMAANGDRLFVAERTRGHGVTVRVATSGQWAPAVSLGGTATQAPAIARLPHSTGVEVAEVRPSRSVAVRTYVPGGTSASWGSIGGTATSAPAVAVSAAGRVAVAVRGSALDLRLREYRPGAGWGSWTSLGSALTDVAPALAYVPGGDLDVFAVTRTQTLVRKLRHAGKWSSWQTVAGGVHSAPVVTVDPSTAAVTVFVRGHDTTLWQAVVGQHGLQRVGGATVAGTPAAAATAASERTVVVEGLDGRLRLARWTDAGWSSWSLLAFD
jgi:beta-N-acetylhexosaminidase